MASLATTEADAPRASAADVAEHFRISKGTVLRLANKGTIPGRRVGKQWRFSLREVDQALRGAA